MDYKIYEHTIGFPDHLDNPMEDLEGYMADHRYTADEAEEFIRKWIPDTDRFGNRRRIYVYRLDKSKEDKIYEHKFKRSKGTRRTLL